jgi:hypothetical protein
VLVEARLSARRSVFISSGVAVGAPFTVCRVVSKPVSRVTGVYGL